MTVTPYMRFYPGDWKQKTQHLEAAVRGVYLELILHIFANGSLPDDDTALARIGGVNVRAFRNMRPKLEPFFIMPGWRQPRAEEEREASRAKSKKAIESANARWRATAYEALTGDPEINSSLSREKLQFNSPSDSTSVNTRIGETFEKTAEALCERIADAYANAMLSESESESKKVTSLSARARLDDLEGRIREAAGLTNNPSAGLFNLAPIIGVIEGGCDLELDVLPTIRARTHDRVKGWAFFVEAIWDTHNRRLAAATPRAAAPSASCQAPLPKGWCPSAEDVDYGKKLGLSQGDLDWTAEKLRNWAQGKTRDDWSAIYRSFVVRKAEMDGKTAPSSSRMIEPQADQRADALAELRRRAEMDMRSENAAEAAIEIC